MTTESPSSGGKHLSHSSWRKYLSYEILFYVLCTWCEVVGGKDSVEGAQVIKGFLWEQRRRELNHWWPVSPWGPCCHLEWDTNPYWQVDTSGQEGVTIRIMISDLPMYMPDYEVEQILDKMGLTKGQKSCMTGLEITRADFQDLKLARDLYTLWRFKCLKQGHMARECPKQMRWHTTHDKVSPHLVSKNEGNDALVHPLPPWAAKIPSKKEER